MKTIYWINDNIQQTIGIMRKTFPTLWHLDKEDQENEGNEKGVATKVVIFGNAFQQIPVVTLHSESEEIALQHKMEDLLFEKCQTLQGATWDTHYYQRKRKLIENSVNVIFKTQIKEDKKREKEDLIFYQELCTLWQDEIEKGKISDKHKEKVREVIERMNFPENACIGIDLVLLHGDIEKTKEEKCIISMELFHQLKQKYKCFLYSNLSFDAQFVEQWKANYEKVFGEQDDVEIYHF